MDNQPITLPAGHILHGPERAYRIVKVLGQGGFGITYLAVANVRVGNINIEGKFAIKEHFVSSMCSRAGVTHTVEYSRPVANEVDRLRRSFLKEVERIHNLPINHPNVIKINEVFEENNTAYYVMEYLGDSHLHQYIKQNGPLPAQYLNLYLRPVVEAVAMLHQHKIAHYDIKPENIMMAGGESGQLRPVLIDFGLAKHYNAQGGLTSFDGAGGYTPGYAPAEQYAGINEYSPAMDVYALAATAYYCLTGKTPPDAFRVKLDEIHAELNAIAGPQVASAIVHAMAMTPDMRTPDAAAFLYEMGWSGEGGTIPAYDFMPPSPHAQTPQQPLRRGPVSNPQPPIPPQPRPNVNSLPPANSNPYPQGNSNPYPQANSNPYPQANSNPQPRVISNPIAPTVSHGQVSNPQSHSQKKGGNVVLWIILGIIGGVAIGVALYFFVLTGNMTNSEEPQHDTENVEQPTAIGSEDQSNESDQSEGQETADEDYSYTDDEGNIHEGYFDSNGEWVETRVTPAK